MKRQYLIKPSLDGHFSMQSLKEGLVFPLSYWGFDGYHATLLFKTKDPEIFRISVHVTREQAVNTSIYSNDILINMKDLVARLELMKDDWLKRFGMELEKIKRKQVKKKLLCMQCFYADKLVPNKKSDVKKKILDFKKNRSKFTNEEYMRYTSCSEKHYLLMNKRTGKLYYKIGEYIVPEMHGRKFMNKAFQLFGMLVLPSFKLRKDTQDLMEDMKKAIIADKGRRELETKINTNDRTIKKHCEELEYLGHIKLTKHAKSEKNGRPYTTAKLRV